VQSQIAIRLHFCMQLAYDSVYIIQLTDDAQFNKLKVTTWIKKLRMDHVIRRLAVLRYSGPTTLVVLGMVAPAEGGANFRSYLCSNPFSLLVSTYRIKNIVPQGCSALDSL
jgi:hypothetical protein